LIAANRNRTIRKMIAAAMMYAAFTIRILRERQ
jgi:hypothetical protein